MRLLTRRADYSIRAMLALSAAGDEIMSGPRIAESMGIPPRFIGQVMSRLMKASLVSARRGRSGGYVLARSPASISILSIIEASGDHTGATNCVLRGGPCAADGTCAVHPIFEAARSAMRQHLSDATLASATLLR